MADRGRRDDVVSWSLSIRPRSDRDELKSAVENAEPEHAVPPESEEQLRAAKKAAVSLIDSGSIGREGDELSVTMAGHSNTDHAQAPGYGPDSVNVTVAQVGSTG